MLHSSETPVASRIHAHFLGRSLAIVANTRLARPLLVMGGRAAAA